MKTIFVTPRSFGKHDKKVINLLEDAGFELRFNPYGRILTEEEMLKEITDVDGIIVGVDPLNERILSQANNLKIISKYGVGTDNIDLNYCRNHNIAVTITNNANSDAVADFAFALILAVARRVVEIDKDCRNLNWSKKTSIGIHGKTIGLIGLGNIGKRVVNRTKGFDMNILAYDLLKDEKFAAETGLKYVELNDLLKESDIISLHLPLNEKTKNIIGEQEFAMMKENAIIVNTARGGLIDEDALYNALRNNKIWGAGIDVFNQEPPENPKLIELNNIVIGSHCAASTIEAVDQMSFLSAQNIIRYFIPNGVL